MTKTKMAVAVTTIVLVGVIGFHGQKHVAQLFREFVV
jgi:hypothetical protein